GDGEQWGGGEWELGGGEEGEDDEVTPRANAAVDLDGDAAPEPVGDQGLVRLGEPDFPGRTGVFDGGQWGGPGATLKAGDGDVVGARLRHPGRHRADANLRHELDRDVGRRIDVLQIKDQLRQILDRIDVVMRRRRNQADPRRRMAHLGDDGIHLVTG